MEGYPDNVRSGGFVGEFESYCASELISLGLVRQEWRVGRPGNIQMLVFEVLKNRYILGGYDTKELDVLYNASTSGPLIGISVKTMMSSINKNVNNRWEEMVGDAANIHSRYPMLVLGFLMVLPYRTGKNVIIDSSGQPTDLARMIERKLLGVSGRSDISQLHSTYERAALAVIDFDATAPARPSIHPDFPSEPLRLDSFFDELVNLYKRRNPYLPL